FHRVYQKYIYLSSMACPFVLCFILDCPRLTPGTAEQTNRRTGRRCSYGQAIQLSRIWSIHQLTRVVRVPILLDLGQNHGGPMRYGHAGTVGIRVYRFRNRGFAAVLLLIALIPLLLLNGCAGIASSTGKLAAQALFQLNPNAVSLVRFPSAS